MKNYVTGLMFSLDKKSVVLIVKNKPDWQAGLLNGIGGKIEDIDYSKDDLDKTIYSDQRTASLNAMVREFEEETGVQTNTKDWRLFLTMGNNNRTNGKTQQYNDAWSVDFYCCFSNKIHSVSTIEDNGEIITIKNISELLSLNTIDNLKWIILLALDPNPRMTTVQY